MRYGSTIGAKFFGSRGYLSETSTGHDLSLVRFLIEEVGCTVEVSDVRYAFRTASPGSVRSS